MEKIIKEFEERAENLMLEYEINPPGINYGAVRDNLSFWLKEKLQDFEEKTKEDLLDKVDTEISKLLKIEANTKLEERLSGWDTLIKLRDILLNRKQLKDVEEFEGMSFTDHLHDIDN